MVEVVSLGDMFYNFFFELYFIFGVLVDELWEVDCSVDIDRYEFIIRVYVFGEFISGYFVEVVYNFFVLGVELEEVVG